jgi:lactate racemase
MMFNAGDAFHYEKLPEGTRVIYPPGPHEPLADPGVAIERALLEPLDMEPLHELFFPGMKLTIAFDDLSLPLPPM